jgi:ATP-binding cassette subfamily B protein
VFENVTVAAAGQAIIRDVDLAIPAGAHVAVVGRSGAGKSTLVGLLLGWHLPAAGRVAVDGQPLDAMHRERLRRQTVWVDPAVQLWNRAVLDNLQYGSDADASHAAGFAVEAADLRALIEHLPQGLQTPLGEGGALVSGGEGQRVRFGRALLRRDVRLVVLDEPFRGLDRSGRRALLARAREHWRDATLICVTHDLAGTQEFERVLVAADGAIVEDGHPRSLLEQGDSIYRSLLETEVDAQARLWGHPVWRRIRIADGQLVQDSSRVSA